MSQIDDLQSNIEELQEAIMSLNEPAGTIKINWEDYFMTPRQIAKKIALVSSITQTDSAGNEIPVDEKSIHISIYGKYLVGSNGDVVDNEIKYPECVDKNRGMSDNHPTMKDKIPNMKKDIKNSFRILKIKTTQLEEATKLASKQIVAGTAAAASALVLLPIGSGLPTAIPALQSIVVAINNLQKSVLEIIPLLGPLVNVPLVVGAAFLDTVLGLVNAVLIAITALLKVIDTVRTAVAPIIKLIP